MRVTKTRTEDSSSHPPEGQASRTPNPRALDRALSFLVLFDVTLTTAAFFFPDFWFAVFHGVPYEDPQGFLRRCGANWAAFALFQAIARARWKQAPYWLAVIAGVRLSDIFTDLVYYFFAEDTTWFADLTLPTMGLVNLALGLYFLRAYTRLSRT